MQLITNIITNYTECEHGYTSILAKNKKKKNVHLLLLFVLFGLTRLLGDFFTKNLVPQVWQESVHSLPRLIPELLSGWIFCRRHQIATGGHE